MFCRKCGKEIDESAVVCIHCGCAINNEVIKDGSAYCRKCGKLIEDSAVVCIHCGCAVKEDELKKVADPLKINPWLMALSVLIPVAGIILWIMKHKEAPKTAMYYGIAGIVMFIINLLLL